MSSRLGSPVEDHQVEQRPSLPSIRSLFGEQLSQPVKRPSPFSFTDLSSSLPEQSRSHQSSPTPTSESPNSFLSSTLNSPRSAWSQNSGHSRSGWPRRHSDIEPDTLTKSLISSHDQSLILPPIISSSTHNISNEQRASAQYARSLLCSSSPTQDLFNPLRRTLKGAASLNSQIDIDLLMRRRHTIPSSDSPIANAFPSVSRHPSLNYASEPTDYLVPSPPSTASGDETPIHVPGERKKLVPKYGCHYCGKLFNRPSSLKIHHNTHTGEKPFACSFPGCERHFSVMSNMRRHARTHVDCSSVQTSRKDLDVEMSDVHLTPMARVPNSPPLAPMPSASTSRSRSHSQPSSATSSPYLPPTSLPPSRLGRPSVRRSHSLMHSTRRSYSHVRSRSDSN